jgi:hypothetical protein
LIVLTIYTPEELDAGELLFTKQPID